jgi:hypothetical protein
MSFRFRRCWRIHWAGFSENRPCGVLPQITETIIIVFHRLLLEVRVSYDRCSTHEALTESLLISAK